MTVDIPQFSEDVCLPGSGPIRVAGLVEHHTRLMLDVGHERKKSPPTTPEGSRRAMEPGREEGPEGGHTGLDVE